MPFFPRRVSPGVSADESRYAALTNRELVAECLNGMTTDAWQEFVRRFQPVISGVVARVAWDFGNAPPTVIDDLAQDVYLKLCADGFRLLRECRMEHDNSIFSYLKFVAASVAHDHFRVLHAHKRRADLHAEDFTEVEVRLAAVSDRWSSVAEEKLLIAKIEEVLEEITEGIHAERDRTVFWLYYRQGLTTSAIAAIPALKLSQKGIESLLSRMTASVRTRLCAKKRLTRIISKA